MGKPGRDKGKRGEREAWEFTVPGQPQGKGRGRIVKRGAFHGIKTPEKTVAYESLVSLHACQVLPPTIDGPVQVSLRLYCKRPKRLMRKKDPDGPIPCMAKPDADNVAKAVLDGMSAHFDDKAVCELHVSKRYTAKGGQARVEVFVEAAG